MNYCWECPHRDGSPGFVSAGRSGAKDEAVFYFEMSEVHVEQLWRTRCDE